GLRLEDVRVEIINLLGHPPVSPVRRPSGVTRWGRMARRAGRGVRAYRTTLVAGLFAPILGATAGAASGAEGMGGTRAVVAAVFYMAGVMASTFDSRLGGHAVYKMRPQGRGTQKP